MAAVDARPRDRDLDMAGSQTGGADLLTVAGMAAVIYCLSVMMHEGVGHGGACLAVGVAAQGVGGVLLRLRHAPRPPVEVARGGRGGQHREPDRGGLGGSGASRASRWTGPRPGLALTLVIAVNLFTWSGYFLFSGLTGIGDWGDQKEAVLWQVEPGFAWRSGMFAFGLAAYIWLHAADRSPLGHDLRRHAGGSARGSESDGHRLSRRQLPFAPDRPAQPGGGVRHPGVAPPPPASAARRASGARRSFMRARRLHADAAGGAKLGVGDRGRGWSRAAYAAVLGTLHQVRLTPTAVRAGACGSRHGEIASAAMRTALLAAAALLALQPCPPPLNRWTPRSIDAAIASTLKDRERPLRVRGGRA